MTILHKFSAKARQCVAFAKEALCYYAHLGLSGWLALLSEIWLWTVAIVFTVAGIFAFCAFIGFLAIGINRLF